jgi:hypothetical protein
MQLAWMSSYTWVSLFGDFQLMVRGHHRETDDIARLVPEIAG